MNQQRGLVVKDSDRRMWLLMQEMLTGATEMERAKQEAMADLLNRQSSLHAFLPQQRVADHHQRISELSAQAAELYNAILAESTRQRPVRDLPSPSSSHRLFISMGHFTK